MKIKSLKDFLKGKVERCGVDIQDIDGFVKYSHIKRSVSRLKSSVVRKVK